MSTSATPANPDPHGPEQLPDDPLLGTGSFIDPSTTTTTNASTTSTNIDKNGSTEAPSRPPQRYTLIPPNIPNPQHAASNDPANGAKTETPLRARRKAEPPVFDSSWLPPGWLIEDRVRTSGVTAGTVDKYYIEPTSGRKFRSKKDVQRYLETGSLPKKKKVTDPSEADANPSEGSSSSKSKSGKTTSKAAAPELKFDALNVPESVEWVLSDANKDSWNPLIGGEKVLSNEKLAWDAAFTSLTTKGGKK